MQAAVDLFHQYSYEAVTVARIAQLAGVSTQTVVLHFKTKENLIEEAATWWAPREEALRDVSDSGNGADPVEAARKISARYDRTGRAVLHVLAIEDSVPGVRRVLENGRAAHRAWVERTFGKHLGTGAARERRIMQLVVAYDIYTWSILRRVLSPEDTILAMAELARGVLDSKGGKR